MKSDSGRTNRIYTPWIACLLLAALNLPVTAAEEQGGQKKVPMDGYIIFGQSNANGRSYSAEFTNEALRQDFGGKGSSFLYAYRERSYQNGSNPEDLPLGIMQPDSRDRIGVEVTLGRQLAAHSHRPVLLVKFCSGGTPIKNFLPDENNLFEPMVRYLKEQQQKAEDEFGYYVNWKGAFVMTGESDSSVTSAPVFRERFLGVQAALEEALELETLPIVYSLLRGNWLDTRSSKYSKHNESAALINASMTKLAQSDPSVRVTLPNNDLKTRFENGDSTGDGIHYCSKSYARLGVRLYQAANLEHRLMIDLNANGVSDIWEAKYADNDPGSAQALRDKQLSREAIDTDSDGISDWAENQLSGFDSKDDDSFEIGEPFSDLPILLSQLEGTKSRLTELAAVWQSDSPTHTTGKLDEVTVDWNGPQHETTATGDAVVTANNQGKKPIKHTVIFGKPQSSLKVAVRGIAGGNRVSFDAPFAIIDNPNDAMAENETIIGNPNSDTQVTLRFNEPVNQLTVSTQGDDATFFRFLTEGELPGRPLQWRD